MYDIYLQDIICGYVAANIKDDDFVIYNKLIGMIEVRDLKEACKVLDLIKLNKLALGTD